MKHLFFDFVFIFLEPTAPFSTNQTEPLLTCFFQNVFDRYLIAECVIILHVMVLIYLLWCQTYTGSILIAVNPFQRLPHLFDSHMMSQYKGADLGELSPHPFAIADAAYRCPIEIT